MRGTVDTEPVTTGFPSMSFCRGNSLVSSSGVRLLGEGRSTGMGAGGLVTEIVGNCLAAEKLVTFPNGVVREDSSSADVSFSPLLTDIGTAVSAVLDVVPSCRGSRVGFSYTSIVGM